MIYVKWFCFEVSELRWPYTEGTWLYCDYFIWCVSCSVVVVTCFVTCGCFGNMCTCIYCLLYCLYCVFVLFHVCIFILICFVCTSVRTTATEWKLNCTSSGGSGRSSGVVVVVVVVIYQFLSFCSLSATWQQKDTRCVLIDLQQFSFDSDTHSHIYS